MNKRDEWITRGDSDDAWVDPWEDSCCRVVDGHMDDCELHRLLEEAKDIDGNQ